MSLWLSLSVVERSRQIGNVKSLMIRWPVLKVGIESVFRNRQDALDPANSLLYRACYFYKVSC